MIKFTIIFILLLPLVFQLLFGSKAIKGYLPLRFWQVSLICVLGQAASAVCNLLIISKLITNSGSRHGLPFIAMLIIEVIAGGILLIIILIQGYIHYRKSKSQIDKRL